MVHECFQGQTFGTSLMSDLEANSISNQSQKKEILEADFEFLARCFPYL
ncbi:MAG: hypothetical protein AAB693_02550 [Patescibacteria group bacterium]